MNTVIQQFLDSGLITKEASERLELFDEQIKEASALNMAKSLGFRFLGNTVPVLIGSALGDITYDYFSNRAKKGQLEQNQINLHQNMQNFIKNTPSYGNNQELASQRYLEIGSLAPTLTRSPIAMKQVLDKTLHKGIDVDTLHKLVNLERNSLGAHTPVSGKTYTGELLREVSKNTGRSVSTGISQYLDYMDHRAANAPSGQPGPSAPKGPKDSANSQGPKSSSPSPSNNQVPAQGPTYTPPELNLSPEIKNNLLTIRTLAYLAGKRERFSDGDRDFFTDDALVLERLRDPEYMQEIHDLAEKGTLDEAERQDFKAKFEKKGSCSDLSLEDFTKTASFGNALGIAYLFEKEAGIMKMLGKFTSNVKSSIPKIWKDVKAPVIALGLAGTVGAAAGAMEEVAEYKRTLNENEALKGSWAKVLSKLKKSSSNEAGYSAAIDYNDKKVENGAKEVFSALAMLAPGVATNPVVASSFVNTIVANENQMSPELVKMITETQKNISASNEYRSPFAKSPLFNGFSAGFTGAGGQEAIKSTISRYVNPRNTENKNNKKIKKPVGI